MSAPDQSPRARPEPYPSTRTAVAPRGRISDPRLAIPLGLVILAVGVFSLVVILSRSGPIGLGILIAAMAWSLGGFILWIGVARWRWMRAEKRRTGRYPAV